MRGDPEVIEILNEVLTNELTAVNQYFLHARMQDNWGYRRLGGHTYAESVDEMRHADEIIQRVLFLEGHPNLQRLNPLKIGETVPEQLEADRAHELHAMVSLRRGVETARAKGDVASALLFERILAGEEEHVDWLEAQLELIRQVGEANYLAQQVHPS